MSDRAQGWYDLTIASDGGDGFSRVLAGHHEGNRPSISDPALGR